MNRCFVDANIWPENEGELSAEESHHLLSVLRSKPGEIIEIFDGQGRVAQAELLGKKKNIARIRVIPESIRRVEPYCPSFILLQAVPKHSNMDLIIQKATELGVKTVVPVITERTVVKFKDKNCNQVCVTRWQKIALASAKQCRTAWLPEIMPPVPIAIAAAGIQSGLKIFGSLAPQTPHFKEFLTKLAPQLRRGMSFCSAARCAAKAPRSGALQGSASSITDQLPKLERQGLKNIALAIGPEGDFTDEETRILLEAGFAPVSFGRDVLRVETAALFGLSVLNYEFRFFQ